jgi:hypothetical protein
MADLWLKWREWRMKVGQAPANSSPAEQEELGLNRDATFFPSRSDGERLRTRS